MANRKSTSVTFNSADRSLSWRWERALELVRSGKRPGRSDGETIRLAVRYMRHLVTAKPPIDEYSIPLDLVPIYFAAILNRIEKSPDRIIEVGLLAGRTSTQIAAPVGPVQTVPEVIDLYKKLCFDVDPPRDREWVMQHAVGWSRVAPGQVANLYTKLRTFAYLGGPKMLMVDRMYFAFDQRMWDLFVPRQVKDPILRQWLRLAVDAANTATTPKPIEDAIRAFPPHLGPTRLTAGFDAANTTPCGGTNTPR